MLDLRSFSTLAKDKSDQGNVPQINILFGADSLEFLGFLAFLNGQVELSHFQLLEPEVAVTVGLGGERVLAFSQR